MTDYYYDESLSTGLNDGSSAANAWQTLSAMLAGLGPLTGADVLHWRTADAGGNLSASYTAGALSLGVAGTKFAQTEIRLDDGTVWPHAGVFQLTIGTTATPQSLSLDVGTYLHSNDGVQRINFIFPCNVSTDKSDWLVFRGGSRFEDFIISITGICRHQDGQWNNTADSVCYVKNWKFVCSAFDTVANMTFFRSITQAANMQIDGLTVDMTGASTTAKKFMFGRSDFGSRVDIRGLNLINPTENFTVVDTRFANHSHPRVTIQDATNNTSNGYLVDPTDVPTGTELIAQVKAFGGNNRYDIAILDGYSFTSYVDNGAYPYLTATLPDNDGYSVSWQPFLALDQRPAYTPIIRHMYNGAAGALTVDLELLILATDTDYDKSNIWIEVEYEKSSDGSRVVESSRGAGALAAGSGSWSALTFLLSTYAPKKLSVTTANSVAANSYISIRMYSNFPRAVAYYVLFSPYPVIS